MAVASFERGCSTREETIACPEIRAIQNSEFRIQNWARSAPGKPLQREYWAAFMEHLRENGRTSTPKVPANSYVSFGVGQPGMRISLVASTYNTPRNTWSEGELRAELVTDGARSEALYKALEARRAEIEAALAPDPVTWYTREGVRMRKVFIRRDADIWNREDWPNQHQWLRERLEKFEQLFRPLAAEMGKS